MSALNLIFLKLIQQMNSYLKRSHDIPFEQWLRRVAVNHIIDEYRKQKRYREHILLIDETPDDMHPSTFEMEWRYDTEEIRAAIDTLPDMSRTVFNLFAVEGYKHEEIAQMLGISTNTSKAHVFKARKKLQELLNNNSSSRYSSNTAIT